MAYVMILRTMKLVRLTGEIVVEHHRTLIIAQHANAKPWNRCMCTSKKKGKKKNVQFLTKRKLDQLRTSRKINILLSTTKRNSCCKIFSKLNCNFVMNSQTHCALRASFPISSCDRHFEFPWVSELRILLTCSVIPISNWKMIWSEKEKKEAAETILYLLPSLLNHESRNHFVNVHHRLVIIFCFRWENFCHGNIESSIWAMYKVLDGLWQTTKLIFEPFFFLPQ